MEYRADQGDAGGRHDPPSGIAGGDPRQAPDFVIIGAQRGGTTSLYSYLTRHPAVGAALRKEIHFFDINHARGMDWGMDWYMAHFPPRGEALVVGEASPFYLFHPEVPARMAAAVPRVKLIALLRNPVDRALSQYHLNLRRGNETRSFEDAIAEGPELLPGSDHGDIVRARRSSYVPRGRYAEQLERWFGVFPREQLLIVKSEDLYADPPRIVHEAFAHLDLPPWPSVRFRARHRADYPAVDAATRRRLEEYYAPHNQRLYALLDRDLGWDRR